MEKKIKPEVPVKPRSLSVTEKARNFEKIATLSNVERQAIKLNKKEIIVKEPDAQINKVIETNVSDNDTTVAEELHDDSSNESSDDSIYYETPMSSEHIYDEILEDTGASNIIEEILSNEKSYIDRLKYVIDNYVEYSRIMGEQMAVIFGNIEEIRRFHENTFYPDLQRCNKELMRILECFSRHIKIGNFYIYVVYSMNKKKSDDARTILAFKDFFQSHKLCLGVVYPILEDDLIIKFRCDLNESQRVWYDGRINKHETVLAQCPLFRKRQMEIDDKLGLHSYLTEPFQRFFKYQNLIESVLKKMRNNELNFMEIAATSRALHDVKKLLNTANKSMALTDIIDSKINLMNQGNFLNQNEFHIFDHNHKRKYKGKIFLFQKCVVCTEQTSSGKLQFKSYFPYLIGHIECINENRFILFERNNYKIELSGDSNVIQQFMEQVREVLMPIQGDNRNSSISSASSEARSSKYSENNANERITKDLESISDINLQRNASSDSLCYDHSDKELNSTSAEYRKSNSDCSSADSGEYQVDGSTEKQQFKEMIKSIDSFYVKVTNKSPVNIIPTVPRDLARYETIISETITIPSAAEIIQEMLTNESDYVRQLTIAIQTYLTNENINVTEPFREKILKIFGNIQHIKEFHENTYYVALKDCENDVNKISDVFSKFTQEGLFSNYVLYAINHSKTQSLRNMKPYREFFEARQKDVDDTQGVEYYLFLPFKHLSMYQYYMERIFDTLNIDTETSKMAACSRARKNIERLIKDMHRSWTSADSHTSRRPMRKISNLFANGIPHNIFKRN